MSESLLQVCDAALEALAREGREIVAIGVNECRGVSDQGVAHLQSGCAKLQCLEIQFTSCTDDGVAALRQARPSVKIDFINSQEDEIEGIF